MAVQFKKFVGGRQVIWDASSLKTLLDCPRKYQLSVIEGWRYKMDSIAPLFGQAVHLGFELLDKGQWNGLEKDAAIDAAIRGMLAEYHAGLVAADDASRGVGAAVRAIVWRADRFWDDALVTATMPDGTPALEVRFECPVNDTGWRFSGRIDRLVSINGGLYIVDTKTTKTTLSSYFFKKYTMDVQVFAYIWACRHILGLDVRGFVIDAMQTAVNFSRFGRETFNITATQIDEWYESMVADLRRVDGYHDEKHFPMNLNACGGNFLCQYLEVCSKPAGVRQQWLNADFEQRPHADLLGDTGDEETKGVQET